jgi:hypothetical protein
MNANRWTTLLAATVVVTMVTGTLGFHHLDPQPGWQGWTTAGYKAVQLFSLNSGVVDRPPTPVLIEISRWCALGSLIGAILATARTLLWAFKSSVRRATMRGHVIVCGAGVRGSEIAKAFARQTGNGVVVVEIDGRNAAIGELRNLGIEVFEGNALDATVLLQAGISKARSLVAVTGNDETNLRICSEVVKDLNSNCELSAGIESWAWRSYYLDRLKSKIRLDSYLSRAAQHLMLEIGCQAARDSALRGRGVCILIEGAGAILQELIRAAVTLLQISAETKPVIHITSASVGDEALFKARFPATHLVAELKWHQETRGQCLAEGGAMPPDFAVFAYPEDIESLEAAERFWMRHDMAGGRVIACLQGDGEVSRMKNLTSHKDDFSVRNLISLGLGSGNPLKPEIEERAKLCHQLYFETYGAGEGDHTHDWSRLSERTRESNRLAAMHNDIKIAAWVSRGGISNQSMLNHLARCEHMRWMAEKAMDGYRHGNFRDKEKRTHDKLVSFDALEQYDQCKDLMTFAWCLDLSDKEWYKLKGDLKIPDEVLIIIRRGMNYWRELRESSDTVPTR